MQNPNEVLSSAKEVEDGKNIEIRFTGGITETINHFRTIITDSSIGDLERLLLTFAFVFSGDFKFWATTLDKWLECGTKKRCTALRHLEELGFAKMVYIRDANGTIKHSYWKISLNKIEINTSSETAISPILVKSADILVTSNDILDKETDGISSLLAGSGEKAVLDEVIDKKEVTTCSAIVSSGVTEKSNVTVTYLRPEIVNIPQKLKDWKQWVFWRGVKHDEADKKPTKIPMNTVGAAKSNDRTTWLPFAAMQTWTQRKMDGIAFVLSDDDPFSMIDIDGCVANESVSEFARKVIEYFDSYTELSPSGTGIRIFVEGKIPAAIKHPKVNDKTLPLEIYSRSRVATVTGHVIRNKPICNRQDKLTRTYEAYKPKPKYFPPANGKHKSNGAFKMPSDPIPEGQRNDTLAKWAGVMKSKGLPEVEYFAYLHQINLQLCQPPLSDKEVDTIGRSLLSYA